MSDPIAELQNLLERMELAMRVNRHKITLILLRLQPIWRKYGVSGNKKASL